MLSALFRRVFSKERWSDAISIVALMMAALSYYYLAGPYDLSRDLDSDVTGHVAKVYTLIEQVRSSQNLLLWGSWDWSIFNGYPFLRIYPFLSYYIWACLSIATKMAPQDIIKAWAYASLALAGISMDLVLRSWGLDYVSSLAGSVLYSTGPYMLKYYAVQLGYVHAVIIFALIPPFLYFLERTSLESKKSACIPLTILSAMICAFHVQWWLGLSFLGFIYALTCCLLKRSLKYVKKVLPPLALGSLVSSYFWVPIFVNLLRYESYHLDSLKPPEPIFQPTLFIFLLIITMGLPIMAFVIAMEEFARKRGETSPLILFYILTFAVLPIWHGIGEIYALPFVGAGAALVAYPLSILFVFRTLRGYHSLTRFLVLILSILIVTLLLFPLPSRIAAIPLPSRGPLVAAYEEVEHYLENDTDWFRVQVIPVHAYAWMTPIRTGHPLLGGWYRQGSPPELRYYLTLSGIWDEIFANLSENIETYIRFMRFCGVKYIVVSASFPDVIRALQKAENAQYVFADRTYSYYVFRISEKPRLISIIPNPGFEDGYGGYMVDTKLGNVTLDSAEARTGNLSLRVDLQPTGVAIIKSHLMPINASRNYEVSVSFKTLNFTSSGMPYMHWVMVRWFFENGTQITERWFGEILDGTHDWSDIKETMIPPKMAKYADTYIAVASSTEARVWIDDLAVEYKEEIEFAPLAVTSKAMGIGGLERFYDKALDINFHYDEIFIKGISGNITLNSKADLLGWRIEQEPLKITVDFAVTNASFVTLPFTYSEELRVRVDPKAAVTIYEAYPNFFCLYVPEGGHYTVYLENQPSELDKISLVISLISLVITMICTKMVQKWGL